MSKAKNLIGLKFGKLTPMYRVESNKDGRAMWHCVCDCGNEVDVIGKSLRQSNTTSCGCSHKKTSVPNKYEIIGDYVKLFTGEGSIFLVDLKDLEKVLKYRWYKDDNGYIVCRRYSLLLHRYITNCPDNLVVDHINHDTTDNRKNNLRICSIADNNKNHKTNSRNKTGRTGVSYDPKKSKFRAYICILGKQKSLGWFSSIDEAILKRAEAEKLYYGNYCYSGGI